MNQNDANRSGPLSRLLGESLPPIPHVRPIEAKVQKLNPETLANGRVNEQKVEDDTQVLLVPPAVSLVAIARALAQFGMNMAATTDGRLRIEYAELTREQVLRLNRENSRDAMNFMPANGVCWSCSSDVLEQYDRPSIVAGLNVTGCRKCHRSFCD